MKFYIPNKMHLIIEKLMPEDPHAGNVQLKQFVWGYNTNGVMIHTGILTAITKTVNGIRYIIELNDDSSMPIDVDHIIRVPDAFLPYVVDAQNNVHRILFVDYAKNELVTVFGTHLAIKDVQPVKYHEEGLGKIADRKAEYGTHKLEPELPNRCREEGV